MELNKELCPYDHQIYVYYVTQTFIHGTPTVCVKISLAQTKITCCLELQI